MMKDLLSFVLVFLSTQNYVIHVIERACQLISKIVKKGGQNCPIVLDPSGKKIVHDRSWQLYHV